MGVKTEIAWTDHTFNPWWGCQRVSPGCEHCYAESFAKRTGHNVWGPGGDRRFFGDKHWAEPLKWNRNAEAAGVRRRVFCASMADVLEDREDLVPHRQRLWGLIEATPWLDWLLLTKRPENARRILPWMVDEIPAWPNVWVGVTAEDQEWANRRVPVLMTIPAVVRFVSAEPLLGQIDFRRLVITDPVEARLNALTGKGQYRSKLSGATVDMSGAPVDWIIVGGESGAGARRFDIHWAYDIQDQCAEAEVAFFMKQMGSNAGGYWPFDPIAGWRSFKDRFRDAKGGNPAEWPEKLGRARAFPRGPLTPRGPGG